MKRYVFQVTIEGEIEPGMQRFWETQVINLLQNVMKTDIARKTIPMVGGHNVVDVRKAPDVLVKKNKPDPLDPESYAPFINGRGKLP